MPIGKQLMKEREGCSYRMLASSLLILFSSSSRALAFLKSAMNCTKPRILELLLLERPRKPPPVEEAISEGFKEPLFGVLYTKSGSVRPGVSSLGNIRSQAAERVGSATKGLFNSSDHKRHDGRSCAIHPRSLEGEVG